MLVAVSLAGVLGVLGARWVVEQLRAPSCEFRAGTEVERLTPEQAANAATITMVSVDRELPRRAATIALATAIQESGLRNLNYGDRDSLGLFQQRPSQGWGTPEQVRDPVYASQAFYDVLVQVPDWQTGEVTVVAQAVQRSAFPDAYADHEGEARVLASVLTGQSHAGIGCRLGDPAGTGSAGQVLAKAERQFGADGEVTAGGVRLQLPDTDAAWAAASWAVAHAQAEQIRGVSVDGHRWDRSNDPLSWEVLGPAGGGTSVTIEVG